MRIIFDTAKEMKKLADTLADGVHCPREYSLPELETCTAGHVQADSCGKCWERALGEVSEVMRDEDRV